VRAVYIVLTVAALVVVLGFTGLFLAVKPYIDRYKYDEYFRQGEQHYNAGNYQAAIEDYTRMIDLKPGKYKGYELRASAYGQAGQPSLAIRDDMKALQLLSTQAGIDEIGMGDLTEEQKQAELPGIKEDIFDELGVCYQNRNDYKNAVFYFTSEISIDPKSADAYWGCANAYDALKQYPRALWNANRFVRLSPRNASAYLIRAQVLQDMGRNAGAVADFTRVIRLSPNDSDMYQKKSDLQEKMHDYAGAVETWRQGVESHPGDQDFLGGYGWEQYLAGDLSGAIATDKQALGVKPADWIEGNLALCYAVQGNWPEASAEYEHMKAHSTRKDIQSSLDDVHNALKTHPNSDALKKAEALLAS
jgi:tetratricopeptide (TPR) repeat protein